MEKRSGLWLCHNYATFVGLLPIRPMDVVQQVCNDFVTFSVFFKDGG